MEPQEKQAKDVSEATIPECLTQLDNMLVNVQMTRNQSRLIDAIFVRINKISEELQCQPTSPSEESQQESA